MSGYYPESPLHLFGMSNFALALQGGDPLLLIQLLLLCKGWKQPSQEACEAPGWGAIACRNQDVGGRWWRLREGWAGGHWFDLLCELVPSLSLRRPQAC